MKSLLLLSIWLLAATAGKAAPIVLPTDSARHVEVLFLGAPTANHPAHDPVERYRILKKALGTSGIDLTYTEDLADLKPEMLGKFDALMFYGNWKADAAMEPARFQALTDFVESGHGFLPIHCASASFGGSDDFANLVGGHFQSHDTGVFTTQIVAKNHPIMRGYKGFETWDETYVHDRLTDDRKVLQVRDKEPWTWVREQGKGRVFYTAYGHDMRCWDQPEFHDLLRRAVLWSVGPNVRGKLAALKLPKLEMEDVILPGYRDHKTITQAQKPLAPPESMKLAQVPVGYELSLFASEPDIVNPIHVAWDSRGRAFVIESLDYPNNMQAGDLGHDRITICEDSDGDGKADQFKLFADKLSIPTSCVFANGGLICTDGPDMIFLQDSDGDDKADVRKVLFTGFGMGDTHAGVSNLRYGQDNWIYATVGYSGFKGTVGGENFGFSQAVFRFKSDGSAMELLQNTTNNTWGLGFTGDFDVLGSTANGNPSWYFTFPKSAYEKAGLNQPRTPAADRNPLFFPSSMDIRQVDQFDRYTAGAGHAFYTSERFPENYRNKIAFVCGPTGKLAGNFEVSANGAGWTSVLSPNNLYNSADTWSAPVQAETGPDGAVWLCDWYNIIIQHNPTPSKGSAGYDAKTGKGNAYETPLRDKSMGRIYRIYPRGSDNDAYPKLDTADLDSLVAGLGHPNLLWRLAAQRMIVDSHSPDAAGKLRGIVKSGQPRAALHAFRALQGLGQLDADSIKSALASSDRGMFRAGLQNAPLDETLVDAVTKNVIAAPDTRLLAETFVALAKTTPSEKTGRLLHATLSAGKEAILADAILADAWQMAARQHATGVLLAASEDPVATQSATAANLISDPGFESGELGAWSLRTYSADQPDAVKLAIVAEGRNGGKALEITSPARADVGAGAEIKVEPNTRYRFGGWVRTKDLANKGGRGALFNIHMGATSKPISGTTGWTELSLDFDSGNATSVLAHCLFGGYGGSTGTAWFDDVSLTKIGAGDIGSVVDSVAKWFAQNGAEADRAALAGKLAGRADAFSKGLAASLGAAPGVVTVEKKFKADPAVHERGLAIFNITCIACHGPDGKGVPGAFPPLDGSPWVTGDPSVPTRIALHGLQGPIEVAGQKFQNLMPPLPPTLTDAQLADVLTYVRQSWSNDATPVTADAVKEIRGKYNSRTAPWTAAELK